MERRHLVPDFPVWFHPLARFGVFRFLKQQVYSGNNPSLESRIMRGDDSRSYMRTDIEDLKHLCQRIIEEQDPEVFDLLVEQLNEMLEEEEEGGSNSGNQAA
jgi:hypothetical protein